MPGRKTRCLEGTEAMVGLLSLAFRSSQPEYQQILQSNHIHGEAGQAMRPSPLTLRWMENKLGERSIRFNRGSAVVLMSRTADGF